MSFDQGPYIQAAGFCETVVEDKLGALSLIRMIDTINHQASGPNPPENMPQFTYVLKLVVMLKSGSARGRYNLKVVPELPSTETKHPFIISVEFEGGEKGNNLVLDMKFDFTMEGLHWFNIYLDNSLLTKVPIRVRYQRITMQRPLA